MNDVASESTKEYLHEISSASSSSCQNHPKQDQVCSLNPSSSVSTQAFRLLSAVDSDLRAATGEVTLGSNNLVVVCSKLHSLSSPGIEVGLHVDGTGAALVCTDGPVLVEGLSAIDGGLVNTLGLRDLVRRAVGGHGALNGGLGRGVVGAEVLDDVVLNQRVASPAVNGEVRVAGRTVGTGVCDGAMRRQILCICEHGMRRTYRAAPGFQPFPPTRLPPVFQETL